MKLFRLNGETYVDANRIVAVMIKVHEISNKPPKKNFRVTVEVQGSNYYGAYSRVTREQAEGLMEQLVGKINAERSEPLTILGDVAIGVREIVGAYIERDGKDTWRVMLDSAKDNYFVQEELPRLEAEKLLAQVVGRIEASA